MAYLIKCVPRKLRTVFKRAFSTPLVYSDEVRRAKEEDRPIVALESTIITHGMPYPKNLETAVEVENIIRERGAVPATVAILKGQLTIGLSTQQLSDLAQAKGVVKASRRDMAPIAALGLDGATTVAGTIIAAELAEIPIFVTGGIGGVHREGEMTMDISADLNELGRSKTLVVCSGVKSILDIGRTLEYLETHGVCVCAFGRNDDFPAFYTPRSGHNAPHRVANATAAAKVLFAAQTLRLASGIVIAVPLPEKHAMDEKIIEGAIQGALEEAKQKGIRGKEVTPFILAAVAKATKGKSLSSNIALIKNNAEVGADIAVQFHKLRKNFLNVGNSKGTVDSRRRIHTSCRRFSNEVSSLFPGDKEGDVLVIGGANVDRTYRVKEDQIQLDGSTHTCSGEQCAGGVGRNVAEALWRLRDGRVRLLTAIGDDADGQYLADVAPRLLLDGCVIKGARTPTYAAILNSKGECKMGLGDMDLHNKISCKMVDKHKETLEQAPLVVLDGNLPQETIDHVLQLCQRQEKPVFFEPTDRRKAPKILHGQQQIQFASPNLSELQAMAQYLNPTMKITSTANNTISDVIKLSKVVSQKIKQLLITLGSQGVITVRNNNDRVKVCFYPVTNILESIQNVSGAGDCFSSGFIHGLLLGHAEALCISLGFEAAKSSLMSKSTVSVDLQHLKVVEAKFKIVFVEN